MSHGIKRVYEIRPHGFFVGSRLTRGTEKRTKSCGNNELRIASTETHDPTLEMPVPPRPAFAAAVDSWLDWLTHNRGRTPATAGKYRGYLARLAAWVADPPSDARRCPSVSDPWDLTAADIELFAGLHAHAEGLTPRARRPLVAALRGFYAWAASAGGMLRENPAAALPVPKVGRALPIAATLAQVERLLMAPDVGTMVGLRDAAIIATLAGCAPRVSGLCGLNLSDLLWTEDDGHEALYLRLAEKGGHVRQVPAPQEVAMLIQGYLAHPDRRALAPDCLLDDGDQPLFVSSRNRRVPAHEYFGEARRLTPRGVRRLLQRHAQRVGVPLEYAHPHALRHLYGAELAEDDGDLLLRQALLGHVDAKSTEVYSHLARRKLRRLADKSNPLAKMRAPLLDTVRALAASANPRSRAPADGENA